MTAPDNQAPATLERPGARHQEEPLMQNERSTRRRVRIGDNLYERPGRTKADTRYQVGYNDVTGTWRMVTLRARNRTDARAERDEFLAKQRRGEIAVPSSRTFGEVAVEYLSMIEALVAAGERSERTLDQYRMALDNHILPVLRDRPIQKIGPEHLARLIASEREAGLASWTVRGHLTPLRRVFGLAARRGYITENPMLRLDSDELPRGKSQSEPRTLTTGEVRSLLAACPARYQPLLATAAFTGMRISEILGLTWGDIDFKAGLIRVRKQLSRGTRTNPPRRLELKTKAGIRDIALSRRDLEPYLKAHLRRVELESGLPRPADFVFAASNGSPLNRNNVAKRGLKNAARDAGLDADGLPPLGFHDLRHTFASHLIRGGMDPVRASRQLGHARPSITLDIYSHLFDEARGLDDIRDCIDAAFAESRET